MENNKYQELHSLIKQENSMFGFDKYVYRSQENADQLFEIIKNSQTDDIGCRFNIWRMSMGIMDFRSEWEQKVERIEQERKSYSEKRNDAFNLTKETKGGKQVNVPKNPLMKVMNEDEFLREEIKKDVDRTYQQMEFFQNEKVLKLLTNVLYVWCKRNPSPSYQQGMNEIGASLIYVYFQSASFEKKKPANYNDVSQQVKQAYEYLNSLAHAEADIYALFEKVMDVQKEMYRTETKSDLKGVINPNSKNNTPILLRIIEIKDHKLKMLDLELFRIIKMQDVQTKSFMLRWIRCMHTREFSLLNSFIIWDSIFLDYYESPSCKQNLKFEFIDAMVVGMFIYMRSVVLTRQTASQIQQVYQKYPSLEKGKYLQELITLAWSLCEALRNQGNIGTNWYEDSSKAEKLHFLNKGGKSPQKQQEAKSEKELGAIQPKKVDSKPEKVEVVQVIEQKQEVPSPVNSPSPERQKVVVAEVPIKEVAQSNGQNFRIYLEASEWKQLDSLLKQSIQLNEQFCFYLRDIESKSLCNKALRILQGKIKQGESKAKKAPLF